MLDYVHWKDEFDNGWHYYALYGQRISAPQDASQPPRSGCSDLAQLGSFQRMTGDLDEQ